jgi:hypothetical protein
VSTGQEPPYTATTGFQGGRRDACTQGPVSQVQCSSSECVESTHAPLFGWSSTGMWEVGLGLTVSGQAMVCFWGPCFWQMRPTALAMHMQAGGLAIKRPRGQD